MTVETSSSSNVSNGFLPVETPSTPYSIFCYNHTMQRLLPVLLVFGVFLGSSTYCYGQSGSAYLTGNQIQHLFLGSKVRAEGSCYFYIRSSSICDSDLLFLPGSKFEMKTKIRSSSYHSALETLGTWGIGNHQICFTEDGEKKIFPQIFHETNDRCFSVSTERLNFVLEDSRKRKIWRVNIKNPRLPETTKEQYASLPPPERTPANLSADVQEELEALRKKVAELKKKKPQKSNANQNLKKQLEERERELARLKEQQKQQTKSNQVAKKTPQPTPKTATSGSGFFVSRLGHVITNQHVVGDCKKVTVGDNAQKQVTADVLETDRRNDLALLKISSLKMASVETKSLIQKLGVKIVPLASDGLLRSEDVDLGEKVLVAGYPYGEIFSNTIKVTGGMISANKGLGDDSGQFQMDAAVQPGNSGGPIYDENGNIVGVVVAQLNKMKFAQQSGSMPENVNFGIKASTVRQFLSASGLPTKWSKRSKSMSTRELAKIAKRQTVMVMCHR